MGAVSDLQQDAAAGGEEKGGKAKLFGGRWKKAGAAAGGAEEGGNKSIFGGRWKKPAGPAGASPAASAADAGANDRCH
jgi:hypothetical protein